MFEITGYLNIKPELRTHVKNHSKDPNYKDKYIITDKLLKRPAYITTTVCAACNFTAIKCDICDQILLVSKINQKCDHESHEVIMARLLKH